MRIGARLDVVAWRRVMCPAEHGAWAFLGEPVLLGLAAAFSPAGALIALAAVAAFLARQPLRLAVADRRRGRRYPRTEVAERAFAACAVVAAGACAGAAAWSAGPVLLPLGLSAPLVAIALALEWTGRARTPLAEVLASAALGGVAAAIALAAGWPIERSLALWAVLAARAVTSVFYVRARVRLDRGERASLWLPLVAHGPAVAAIAWLARRDAVPELAVWAMVVLVARAAHGLSPWRPRWSIRALGASEISFGLVVVAAVWLG